MWKHTIKIESDRTRWTLEVEARVVVDSDDQLCIEDVRVTPVSGAYKLITDWISPCWLPFDLDEYGGDDLGADVANRFEDEICDEIARLYSVEGVTV